MAWRGKEQGTRRKRATTLIMKQLTQDTVTAVPFMGGVPTKPEVDKLLKKYQELQPGNVITYDEIAGTILVQPDSYRYRTIVHAWRQKLLRDRNVLLLAQRVKYVVATPSERIGVASKKVHSGKRKILRGSELAAATEVESLTEEERKTADHIRTLPARLRLAELTYPKSE